MRSPLCPPTTLTCQVSQRKFAKTERVTVLQSLFVRQARSTTGQVNEVTGASLSLTWHSLREKISLCGGTDRQGNEKGEAVHMVCDLPQEVWL